MSVRHSILNFSGFFSITSLRNATQHSMTSNMLRIHFLQYPWCTSDRVQLGYYMGLISREMQKYELNKSMNIPVFTELQQQQCSTVACMHVCPVVCLTCAMQRKGCWGWAAPAPLAAWFPSHWPSAGSPESYQPCRWPSPSSTWIYIHSWETDRQTECLYLTVHCGSGKKSVQWFGVGLISVKGT